MDDLTPDQKGNIAEAAVALHAIRLGIEVYRPTGEGGRFDMVFVFPSGELSRVPCKWVNRYGDVLRLMAYSNRRTANGLLRRAYTADQIDAFAAYCLELDRVFYIPIEIVNGRQQIALRLAPTRNGQRGAINWAAEYELGAVAQLEERRRGTAEATGSSPVSSTSLTEGPTAVGSDEFRTRQRWYFDRASRGEEFVVTYRGKPRFRVGPV